MGRSKYNHDFKTNPSAQKLRNQDVWVMVIPQRVKVFISCCKPRGPVALHMGDTFSLRTRKKGLGTSQSRSVGGDKDKILCPSSGLKPVAQP